MRRGGGAREVSESAMTLLVTEAAHHIAFTQGKGDEYLMSSLEAVGFRAGVGMMERHMHERTHLLPLHQDADGGATEAVKLLCKDIWRIAFNQPPPTPKYIKPRKGYSLKCQSFKWLQHIVHRQEGQYVSGMRCVLAKQTSVTNVHGGTKTYPAGTKAIIVQVPQQPLAMTPAAVAEVDISIEGLIAKVDTSNLDVDSPPRLNPHVLLHIPAGMIRGWLYGLGIVARVEPKLIDPKPVDSPTATIPAVARQQHVDFDITTEPAKLA